VLRDPRPLLFTDTAQVLAKTPRTELDALVIAHHLIARSDAPALQLPHVRNRWTEAEYVAWWDAHDDAEVTAALRAAVEAYAADANRRGDKQYVLEYPAIVRLLDGDAKA